MNTKHVIKLLKLTVEAVCQCVAFSMVLCKIISGLVSLRSVIRTQVYSHASKLMEQSAIAEQLAP